MSSMATLVALCGALMSAVGSYLLGYAGGHNKGPGAALAVFGALVFLLGVLS